MGVSSGSCGTISIPQGPILGCIQPALTHNMVCEAREPGTTFPSVSVMVWRPSRDTAQGVSRVGLMGICPDVRLQGITGSCWHALWSLSVALAMQAFACMLGGMQVCFTVFAS